MSLQWIESVVGLEQAGTTDGDPTWEWAKDPPTSSWAIYFRTLDDLQFDMDFPKMHAMIHWLHAELLECTVNFVQEHKLTKKANPLIYASWSKEAYMLAFTEWKETDERELTDWTFLIGHTTTPDGAFLDGFSTAEGVEDSIMGLLRSADEIRHAAAHHRSISVGHLFKAMLLPHVLKDSKRAGRIEQIFYAIFDEAGNFFDENTRKEAELTIFTLPSDTVYQKLARLESLLQQICFEYAQHKDPSLLSNSQWDMPEEVEISKLGDWRFKTLLQNDFPDVKFDPEAFWQTVDTLRQMRNDLWHRNPVSDIDFLCFVHAGIRFAIFVGNRAKAIEVEIEAETMLTGCSREQVLARLHRVFLAADLPKDEDDRRRECRRRVAIGKILEESGTELSNHQLFTTWNYIFQYPRPKEEFREEVFIEDRTLAVKVPLSDVTWPMEEDTEETYQEETYQEETEQEDTDTPGTDIQDRNTQETDIKRTDILESMTQVSNRSHPKAGERTDTAPEFSEVSPSATTFAPGAIPYRSSETLYNGEPLLDYPLAATTPEIAIQRGLATAAEDEHKIFNLDRNVELGIAVYLDLEAASTVSSPSIPLFTFSPSMHECLKW